MQQLINRATQILNYAMGINAVIDEPFMTSIVKNLDELITEMNEKNNVAFYQKQYNPFVNDTAKDDNLLGQSIKQLRFTVRTHNCLIAENIETIGQLISKTAHELLRTPNLDKKSLKEIETMLAMHNLTLGTINE